MPAHRLNVEALPGYAEIIETAWATGTDPLELLRVHPEYRSGQMNRAVRAARKEIRAEWAAREAERKAYELEERARAREARRNRLAVMGRTVRVGGATLTEREADTVRAALDVKGPLRVEHMERYGAYRLDGEWIGISCDYETAAGGY